MSLDTKGYCISETQKTDLMKRVETFEQEEAARNAERTEENKLAA